MRCESSSWNVTDTLRTVTTITSNWKGMSRMIWFTSSITRWMRIDGTEYWKDFFLFLFPSSGIPESFYLRNEKRKIFHLHNLTTQFEISDSSIPETQWWNECILFWNMLLSMLGIFLKRHLCHVLYFCPTIIFRSRRNGAFFFFMFFHTHRILVIFLDHVVQSECEFRLFGLACNPLGSY